MKNLKDRSKEKIFLVTFGNMTDTQPHTNNRVYVVCLRIYALIISHSVAQLNIIVATRNEKKPAHAYQVVQ